MSVVNLVYLAGPIIGLDWRAATSWRDDAAAWLSNYARCLSPLRGKDYLDNGELIYHEYSQVLSTGIGLTARDRWDVSRCDVVLVNLLGHLEFSIGTAIELGWADAYRKPVVMVVDENSPFARHPMVRQIAQYVVPDLWQGFRVVKDLLG